MPQPDPVVTVSLSREQIEIVLGRLGAKVDEDNCLPGCPVCEIETKLRAALDSQEVNAPDANGLSAMDRATATAPELLERFKNLPSVDQQRFREDVDRVFQEGREQVGECDTVVVELPYNEVAIPRVAAIRFLRHGDTLEDRLALKKALTNAFEQVEAAAPADQPADPRTVQEGGREPGVDEWCCDSCGKIAPAETEGWEQTPQDDAGVTVEFCSDHRLHCPFCNRKASEPQLGCVHGTAGRKPAKHRYPHDFPGAPGHNPDDPGDCFTSNCRHGCGAWMGPVRSGSSTAADPHGDCPKHPDLQPPEPGREPGSCERCDHVAAEALAMAEQLEGQPLKRRFRSVEEIKREFFPTLHAAEQKAAREAEAPAEVDLSEPGVQDG